MITKEKRRTARPPQYFGFKIIFLVYLFRVTEQNLKITREKKDELCGRKSIFSNGKNLFSKIQNANHFVYWKMKGFSTVTKGSLKMQKSFAFSKIPHSHKTFQIMLLFHSKCRKREMSNGKQRSFFVKITNRVTNFQTGINMRGKKIIKLRYFCKTPDSKKKIIFIEKSSNDYKTTA